MRQIFALSLIVFLALGALSCRAKVEEGHDKLDSGPAPSGSLRIYMLDVGQGDSLLILSPQGKSVLIDAGPPDAGDEVIAALRKHAVKQIDLAVATHPHADHIGGMKKVMDALPVKKFLDSGQTYTSATYERMLREIQENKIGFIKALRGQTLELEPGIKLEVLNPGKELLTNVRSGGSVENANSVVLRLSYGNFAMLFTGDAEFETEAQMMDSGMNLKAQVLKIGHHGSRHATSGKFLEAVNPQVAVISAAAVNDYGHPSQDTLDRLKRANIKTFRTDLNGEIEIYSDGKTFNAHPAQQVPLAQTWEGHESPKRRAGRATE
ncbi:MAG: ComEC/Rec2 family competence protein [Blastocatellia bacterium]